MTVRDLNAYQVIKDKKVNELNSDAMILEHKKTGARIFLLSNDDENKVFCIGFRTPPSDSTGVPHILEHSVLCGSAKFPVKDPFVELVKGSLNTFLNAMTYPDKTVYPVASSVKDYIRSPKANGYRSYHMIVEVPVFFSNSKKNIRVEVQIRTIAMDFWASLDHQLKYKKKLDELDASEIGEQLRECAETIARTDWQMLDIRRKIEEKGFIVQK